MGGTARLQRICKVFGQGVLAVVLLQQTGDKVVGQFGQLRRSAMGTGADQIRLGINFLPLCNALSLRSGNLLVQVLEQFPVGIVK